MPTTGVDFVFNNLQAVNDQGTVVPLPVVLALEPQSAFQQSQRQPGGIAYQGDSNVAAPAPANAQILLDGIENRASKLPYAKNGAFLVKTNGTTTVSVPFTNTATNTNSTAGDTVFAKWNRIYYFNLSGLDGVNSAAMTVNSAATNGLAMGIIATNAQMTIDGSSCHQICTVNGITVNATNNQITITPTAGGVFGCVIMGS